MPSLSNDVPSIAVCLAAFNGVRYLQQQVDSILNQTGVNVTIFASIDRSMDGTEAWFLNLQALDSRIVVLPTGETFGGAAQNFFRLLRDCDFSGFDYVAFADQDDIWLPGKLTRAKDSLIENGADGYSSDVVAFWESGKSLYIKKSFAQRKWDYLFESAGPGCTFVISCKLAVEMQRVLQQKIGELAQIGLHDWFIYVYARARGYQWVIDGYASLMYRQHAKNQVGVNAGWVAFVWRARQVLSGWGLNQARLIAGQIGLHDDVFVRSWVGGGRWRMLRLAFQAANCRRRSRDQWLFALSCVALAFVGWK
ncbi:MAG: glycosyltransferase [Rhodoferax sp.]|nr:glycosyltransferase [Rhodoferax sp.]